MAFLKKYSYPILFCCILLLAFVIRVYQVDKNPPGFFCDEAAIGYNAFKLLTTGKDEYGIPFPVFFRSFGDYRLPIPIYANIISVFFFSMTEFAVRFTTVIFGMISIIFTMLAVRRWVNMTAALSAGLIMAIIPWHIQLSRWGSEYMYFPALIAVGLYFVSRSLEKPRNFIIAMVFFALSLYTYYPTLFITPLLVVGMYLLFIFRPDHKKFFVPLIIGAFVFFVLCIPLFQGFANGTLMTRWNSINNQQTPLFQKMQTGGKTYLADFSLSFLFTTGDSGYPGHAILRHSVLGFGELYLFLLPLLLIGGYSSLKQVRKNTMYALILWLLLLFPLGSAVANDGPLATRSVLGVLPLSILSGIGLSIVLRLIMETGRILRVVSLLVLFFVVTYSLSLYLYGYFTYYPRYAAGFWGWQYGASDIVHYFAKHENKYDELAMQYDFNAAAIFFSFYAPNDCQKCMIGTPDQLYDPKKKQLFAVDPQYLQTHKAYKFRKRDTVKYPNGSVAFEIGEVVE